MVRNLFSFLSLVILLLFAGCKKDSIQLSYTELNTGADKKLKGICFRNENTGFVCGGEKDESGFILKTTDGGLNWQQVASYDLAVYDITFVNDSLGFACGDSLLAVKTTDGGQTWNKLEIPFVPVVIAPFTSIHFTDAHHIFICGGKNWEEGVAMRTDGEGAWEYQAFYNTQVTENYFINDSIGYLAAYGAVYKATSDVLVNNLLGVDGDFFTSVCFTSADDGFVCGYDGGIYKTTDAGATWKQVRKDNAAFSARTHFNKIRFAGAARGLSVGNNGAVYYSDDAGDTWKESDNFPDEHIYSAFVLSSTTVFLCADAGKVYRVAL